MNILGSNVHYFYYDTAYFFRQMKRCGYHAVELYAGTPHIFIDGRVIDDFDGIAALAEENGVSVGSVHAESISYRYGLCYLDEKWNADSLSAHRNLIDYAAEIGAEQVVLAFSGVFRDQNRQQIFRRAAGNLSSLAEYGQKRGIRLAVENTAESIGLTAGIADMGELLLQSGTSDIEVQIDAAAAEKEGLISWLKAFGKTCKAIRIGEVSQLPYIKEAIQQADFHGDLVFFPTAESALENPAEIDRDFLETVRKEGIEP